MRFLLGLLVGLLPLAGYIAYGELQRSEDPCLGVCGAGTRCAEGECLTESEPTAVNERKRPRRSRRSRARRRQSAEVVEPALRKPNAADLEQVTKGAALEQTEYLDLSSSGGEGRELSTTEVNQRVRALDRRIVACIDRARGDYDIAAGRVLLGFRIERSGAVKRVRVAAPALLQRNGLYACIRPLVASLRFPRSSRALVMSYPYQLH